MLTIDWQPTRHTALPLYRVNVNEKVSQSLTKF